MTVLKEGIVGGALNVFFIYKFLRILTTPWENTDAFKLGIIDGKGKILKKKSKLKTIKEKDSYTMMHRLVWKLKRLMEKVPFGKSRLASYAAALWLIKEETKFNGTDNELQESFLTFLETDWKNNALILKENYEGDMDKKTYTSLKDGIDIKKASMKDVIKDFQKSDAPQFKGKTDEKKKEMAIAAKLSKEEVEIDEAILVNRDYKYDGKVIKISKKNFRKVHKDFKGTDKGKETMITYDSKWGTVLVPVEFTEGVVIDESTKEYAKSLEKIANDRALKMLSKSERENLKKIADLLAKEEVELDEKWAVGVVYHQEYKGGDRTYFRADSVQKNTRWKGMSVDEIGGKQKKPKNNTADEKVQGWEITPKNEIPKSLKEEVLEDGTNLIVQRYREVTPGEVDEKKVPKIKFKLKQFKHMKPKKKSSKKSSSSGDREFAFGISRKGGGGVGSGYGTRGGMMFNGEVDEAKGTAYPATIDTLKMIVKEKQNQIVMFDKGQARVDLFTASAMVQVYDSLKPKTKKKFEDMIKTKAGFMKSQAFAMKMMEETEYEENIEVAFIEEAKFKLNQKQSGSPYKLYHKTFSDAMQHAYDHAKKKGVVVDKKEIDDKVATGPKKPSKDKTNRYELKAGKRTVMIQVANLDNKRYELNMYIEGKEELSTFSKYITEGRGKQDPDYVPGATDRDKTGLLRKLIDAQRKHYTEQEIKSIARKYKQNVADITGGKDWQDQAGEWIITLMNSIELTYDYNSNTTTIRKWKFDKKKAEIHLAKYGSEHETVRDMKAEGGGQIKVGGFEAAFELMFGRVGRGMFEEVEIDEIAPWKKGNYTVKDQDGKVLGRFKSGAKAQKFVDKIWDEGDYDSLTVELGEEVVYTYGLDEEAPANSVAGGNVNLDPFVKKKRKNAKVQWEMFGGQKVFVVSPERFYDSRLGKARYVRYEKYVGNDKLGETIRQYGRNNPKNSIILKNSGNGAMLYLKYGRK